MGSSRRKRRAIRMVRFVMLAIVALEVVYVLAANIMLRAGLFQHVVNSHPNSIWIAFDSAWTIVPGRVHFRHFELRQQDNHVQSLLRIEEGTFQLKFLPLIKKRFHATSVDAIGTSFRFRHKVSKESLVNNLDRLALYPPIHGYSDPPILTFPYPPSDPDRLWKIELDGVDAHIDELWFLEYRYAGRARVQGAFRLNSAERLWVGPAVLSMGPGHLGVGLDRVVAPDFQAWLWVKVDDFDVNALKGWAVFDPISVSGWLKADVAGLDFSDLYLPRGTTLTEGAGRLAVVGGINHGTFVLGSRIDYATERARLLAKPYQARGGLDVTIAVEPGRDRPIGVVRASSPRVEIDGTGRRADVRAAVLTRPQVEIAGSVLQIDEEWRLLHARIDLPSVAIPDLALMNVVTAPADVIARQGVVTGKAHVLIDAEGRMTGRVEAALRDARVVIQKVVALQGNGSIAGRLAQAKVGRGPGRIEDVDIALEPLSVTSHDDTSGHGSLRVAKGVVLFRDLSLEGFKGTIVLQLPDAEPILQAINAKTDSIPGLARAVISNDNLRATVRVSHEPAATDIEILDAHTDNASVEGRWRRDRSRTRGVFLVHTKVGNAGVAMHDGGSSVKIFAGQGWFQKQLQNLGLLREKGGT